MSDFFIQATNLLAQQLAMIKGEEIYTKTSCMDPEYRQTIAVLEGIKQMQPKLKGKIDKIEPLLELLGKASWIRSELTDLGLRVGQRNVEDLKDNDFTIDDKKPGEP